MKDTKSVFVTVLIAHPEVLIGELLEAALNRRTGIRVTARATCTKSILELAAKERFAVALVNASLTDGPQAGYHAVRQLRSQYPEIRSVMLFDRPTADQIVSAFHAGARGVFRPSVTDFKMLCRCVERVHSGQVWATSEELGYLVEALETRYERFEPLHIQSAHGLESLSKREEDVLKQVSEGLSNRAIAKELKLSVHTVKNYLYRIFDKIGVSSRTELLVLATKSWRRDALLDEARFGASGAGSTGLPQASGTRLLMRHPQPIPQVPCSPGGAAGGARQQQEWPSLHPVPMVSRGNVVQSTCTQVQGSK